jgi:CRISPR-associated protein Csh2
MSNDDLTVQKSEILFLYESTYSIPNGDPFTGEQRYDDETKKILVSDVRIKRFIRDYFFDKGLDIFVVNDKSALETNEKLKGSGAALRMKTLKSKYGNDADVQRTTTKGKAETDTLKLMQKCIDVRLFGGISTEEGDAVNVTGPVQFALLNPSLNRVDLRIHQNTSVFSSSEEKTRGAIGTTTVVPYALNQIHGWINPYSARHTGLSEDDVKAMFKALWESVNNANTRTKSNQNSLLLLQLVYSEPTKKLYGVDRFIKLEPKERRDEQIRNSDDYSLDFSRLKEAVNPPVISAVNFYTEKKALCDELTGTDKFSEMSL